MAIANLPENIIDKLNFLDLGILTNFQFAVQIDGSFTGSHLVMGFDRVSGIGDKVDVREIKEGGYPVTHKFPRRSQSRELRLTRGMTLNRNFYRWYEEVRSWTRGKPGYRRTMSIYMLDHVSKFGLTVPYEVWRFDIFNAFPSEWIGPELTAREEGQAFETIVIQHTGISEAKSAISDKVSEVVSLF